MRTSAARAVDAGCKGTLPSSERRFLDRSLRDYEFSLYKGTLLGTPNREPQVYSYLCTYYILGVPSLGFPVESLYCISP